jgi:hypothetical protein
VAPSLCHHPRNIRTAAAVSISNDGDIVPFAELDSACYLAPVSAARVRLLSRASMHRQHRHTSVANCAYILIEQRIIVVARAHFHACHTRRSFQSAHEIALD